MEKWLQLLSQIDKNLCELLELAHFIRVKFPEVNDQIQFINFITDAWAESVGIETSEESLERTGRLDLPFYLQTFDYHRRRELRRLLMNSGTDIVNIRVHPSLFEGYREYLERSKNEKESPSNSVQRDGVEVYG